MDAEVFDEVGEIILRVMEDGIFIFSAGFGVVTSGTLGETVLFSTGAGVSLTIIFSEASLLK